MKGLRRQSPALHLVVFEPLFEDPSSYALDLPPQERVRATGIAHGEARALFLQGRIVLRRALERIFGLRHARIDIDRFGRPGLVDSSVRFNLSHTRGAVAVVLGDGFDVGVDIERLDRRVDVPALARRSFSDIEAAWVTEADSDRRFLETWTLKEAFMKGRGLGFRLPPRSFAFDLRADEPRIVRSRDRIEDPWIFHRTAVGPLQLAVAAGGPAVRSGVTLHRYRGSDLFSS
ncbi:MAG: 4'-phosphopantetheinyl transferase superfamily protein [Myxococcota bacterium]